MTPNGDDEILFAQYGPEGPIGHTITVTATTGSLAPSPYPGRQSSSSHASSSLRSLSHIMPTSSGVAVPASRPTLCMPISGLGAHISTNHIQSTIPTVITTNIPSSQSPTYLTNQIPSAYTRLPSQFQLSPFPISSPLHTASSIAPPPLPSPHPSRSPLPKPHPPHPPRVQPHPSLASSLYPRHSANPHRDTGLISARPGIRARDHERARVDCIKEEARQVVSVPNNLGHWNHSKTEVAMSSFNAAPSAANGEEGDMDPSRKKKTCVTCGKKVYDNFTECPHCTTLFRDTAGKVVRCGSVGKKVCLQCGFSNPVRCFTCKKCDYLFQPKPKIVKPPAKRGRKPKNKSLSAVSDKSKSITKEHSHGQHGESTHTPRLNTLHGQEALHDQDDLRRSSSSSPASPPLPYASGPSHVNLRVRSPSGMSPNGGLHGSPSSVPSIPGLPSSSPGRVSSLAATGRTASNSGSGSASASGSGTDGGMGALHSSGLPIADHPKLLPLPSSFMPVHQTHRHSHDHEHTHGHRHRSHLHPR